LFYGTFNFLFNENYGPNDYFVAFLHAYFCLPQDLTATVFVSHVVQTKGKRVLWNFFHYFS